MDPHAPTPRTLHHPFVDTRLLTLSARTHSDLETSSACLRELFDLASHNAARFRTVLEEAEACSTRMRAFSQSSALQQAWWGGRVGDPLPVASVSAWEHPVPVRQPPVIPSPKKAPGRKKQWTADSLQEAIVKVMVGRLLENKPITQPVIASIALNCSEGTLYYHLRQHGLSFVSLRRQARADAIELGWIAR